MSKFRTFFLLWKIDTSGRVVRRTLGKATGSKDSSVSPSCSLGPGPLRSPRSASEFAIKYVYICICVDFQTFTYLYVWIFINKPHGDSFFWLGLVQSAEGWRLTEPKQKMEIWSYIRFTYRKTGYGSYVYICICIDFPNCTYVYVWIFMNKPYEDSFFLAWLSSVCGRLKADWT